MKSEIIHNKDIDRLKWDAFTVNSSTAHVFNLSWYLDIVFPEWQALIVSDEKGWIAVLPLFSRKKYGFNISLQPLLIRYSGVISDDVSFDRDELHQVVKNAVSGFSIYHFTSVSDFLQDKFKKEKLTYILDISSSYNQILSQFKGSLRNKIGNFNSQDYTISEDKSTDALIQLYQYYTEIGKFKVTADYYEKLEKLYKVASDKNMAKIVTARNSEMEAVASLLYFYFAGTIYLFIGLTHQNHKKTAIHPYLIANEIKEKSGTFNKFDFLGSMIPSVAKFNKSFGAIPHPYHEVFLKKFPFNLLPV